MRRLTALMVLTALLAGACAASGDPGTSADATAGQASSSASAPPGDASPVASEAAATFPVEISHAFGTTTIASEPERVVAVGWGSADAAIALGVVPVALPFQGYGSNEDNVLPWVAEALEAMGAPVPPVLPDDADGVPFEAIAAADPDVILAQYSGITEDDYALLGDIAPTVAYPDEPWTTPWREVVEIAGTALGRSEEAATVLADIDATLAETAEAHPELDGLTVANVVDLDGTFYIYYEADPRVRFMTDLGMEIAESVEQLPAGESTFYTTISYENLPELTSDVLVVYSANEAETEAFLTEGPTAEMAQVTEGRVAVIEGESYVAAIGPPTALSLTWGLDAYVEVLTEAAEQVGAAS